MTALLIFALNEFLHKFYRQIISGIGYFFDTIDALFLPLKPDCENFWIYVPKSKILVGPRNLIFFKIKINKWGGQKSLSIHS